MLLPLEGLEVYTGVYHVNGVDGWTGATAFYRFDQRAPMAPEETKTWTPIHVWSDPEYTAPECEIVFSPMSWAAPPPYRSYTLELLYVPPEVTGAPPVGTVWDIPHDTDFALTLPSYPTANGLTGYRFAFTVGPADPCYGLLTGDSNCDGTIGFSDINPFVAALVGPAAWEAALGGNPACDYVCANDVNEDGTVDFGDINPFVALLVGG